MDKGPDSIGTNIFEEFYNIISFRQVKNILPVFIFDVERV